MNRKELRRLCEKRSGVTAEYPFGPEVRVYKVLGRVFALVPEAGELHISLKCDPALAEMLRQRYQAITPGYHLNKRHWNTIAIDGTIPPSEVREMIVHSYELVASKLPKAARAQLASLA